MAHGLRIRPLNGGAPIVDITDRLTRTIGTFSTGVANGSFVVPADYGTAFFVVLDVVDGPNITPPQIQQTNNTLSWTFAGISQYWRAVTILYGVY